MRAASLGRMFLWPVMLSALASGANCDQLAFPSPEDAANALIAAVESGDHSLLLSILGDGMAPLWNTDNPRRDGIERGLFPDAPRWRGLKKNPATTHKRTLHVNGIAEPFPAPLVKTDSGWRFD